MVDAEQHPIPPSKTRDLLAVWSEFGQLALKYNGNNFSQGAPGLAPPQWLLDSLGEVVKTPQFNQYCPVVGHPELRAAIAKAWTPYFKGREIDANKNVLVTNGALGAMHASITNLCNKGDIVHTFEPFFSQYVNIAEFAGASMRTSPMHVDDKGDWHFDFDHFEKSLDEKSKVLILNNPHNPTGRVFTTEELDRVSKILDKHPQVTVISDEVYFHLPFDGLKMAAFANQSESNWKRTISIFSFGKMLNATGWKIGFAIAPAHMIKQAFFVHEAATFNCNVPGQVAIARVVDRMWNQEHEGHKNYFEWTIAQFEAGRAACLKMLEESTGIKFKPTKVESGYFMCVDITGSADKIPAKYFEKNANYEADENTQVKQMQFDHRHEKVPLDFAMCRYLAVEKGISCMPCTNFALAESETAKHNYIRIAICQPATKFTAMNETFKGL